MRRTFSKAGLQETWDFYQETQGPKTLGLLPEDERQVPNDISCNLRVFCIYHLKCKPSQYLLQSQKRHHSFSVALLQDVTDLLGAAADGDLAKLEKLLKRPSIVKRIDSMDEEGR